MANQFIVKNGLIVSAGGAQITGSAVVSGSLSVFGDITANQLIISSSVSYFTESFASGSHKFGDSLDDTHVFTGSFKITGSLAIPTSTGTPVLNATGALYYNTTDNNIYRYTGTAWVAAAGSSGTSGTSGSSGSSGTSGTSGSSGSSGTAGTSGSSGTSGTSGSSGTAGTSGSSGSAGTSGSSGSNGSSGTSGTSGSSGSSGSSGTSGLSGTGGLVQSFTASTTWSVAHNLNTSYPLVNVWDDSNKIVIPTGIESIDVNNIKVYFSSAQAGNVNVARGGHFISGSVPASNISGLLFTGSFTNSATWSVVHNLNSDYPSITVWNSSRDVVIPTRINSVDANNVNVYFSSEQTGKVVIVKGL